MIEKTDSISSPNPTKSSLLPRVIDRQNIESVHDEPNESPILQDSEGRRYHMIYPNRDHARDQLFLARLVKGIIPVSDVLYLKSKKLFVSYEVPIDQVETNIQVAREGAFILRRVFGVDDQHVYDTAKPWHNFQRKDDAVVFFDFGEFREHFLAPLDYLMDQLHQDFGNFDVSVYSETEYLKWLADGAVDDRRDRVTLKNLLHDFRERLAGDDGIAFMASILKEMEDSQAGAPALLGDLAKLYRQHSPVLTFQKIVLARIEALESVL